MLHAWHHDVEHGPAKACRTLGWRDVAWFCRDNPQRARAESRANEEPEHDTDCSRTRRARERMFRSRRGTRTGKPNRARYQNARTGSKTPQKVTDRQVLL